MITYNLFLDDFRVPEDAFVYTRDREFMSLQWDIVRSHEEFVKHITERFKNGEFPGMIAFDHDLDDAHYEHTSGDFPYDDMKEKTGMHSAKWIVDFCIDNKLKLPDYKVHSMNPGGRDNIEGLLTNFKAHQIKNGI